LVTIMGIAVLCGAIGAGVGWLAAQGKADRQDR
jgi:hypothetical protein